MDEMRFPLLGGGGTAATSADSLRPGASARRGFSRWSSPISRDWPVELWPTSFKGIPFWTRKVDSEFGQRLQKDEFPGQDDPAIQQLGNSIRSDEVDAYLVGDTSDDDAAAFVAALVGMGSGALVLPDQGPTEGFFEKGRRAYELDRQGYIGFSLTFVRGAAQQAAATSPDLLANQVSDAADALGDALAALTGQVVLF